MAKYIYIGGKALAIGYLDDARLTDTRFVDDPFTPGQHIYRSGDNCHWDPNDQLRFVVRTDNVAFNMLTLPKLDMQQHSPTHGLAEHYANEIEQG